MALDFSKLHDAIGKVATLAQSHADTSALVAQHKAELDAGQKQIDTLVEQLLAAAGSPTEKVGLAAVAGALNVAPAPGVTHVGSPVVASAPAAPFVAPAAPSAPVIPAVAPVAPVAPPQHPAIPAAPTATFLPGDPRANVK